MKGVRLVVIALAFLSFGLSDAEAQPPLVNPLQPPIRVPNPNMRAARSQLLPRRPYRPQRRRRRPRMGNVIQAPRVSF